MAQKKIGEFTKVVPNSGDRILIEQNGAGRSAVLSSLPVSDPTMEALNDVRKEVAKVYKFKGTVTHKTDLPATGIVVGDAYNVSSEGKTYAYNGSSWIAIGVDTVTDEVLQAREGYDGTIYSDLGTAIRTQVSSLNASQDQVAKELKGDIFDLTGIVSAKIDYAAVENGELVLYANHTDEIVRLSGFGGGGGTGGGGAVTSSVLTVRNTSGSLSKTISYGDECILSFNWESLLDGEETGNGALTVKVDGVTKVLDKDIAQGDVSIDVGGFLKENKTHRVSLYVKDIYSVQRPLHFSITTIALSLKSAFQDSLIQPGPITFLYTPVGEGIKTMHVSIDDVEVWTKTTAVNNRQEIANLAAQTHGVHTIKAWFTATVNSQDIVSNILNFMVICTEEGKTDPIIALRLYEDQLKQYYTYDIRYQVWTPAQLTDVTLNDGETITELKDVSTAQNIWAIRKDTQGTYTLSITAAGLTVSKTITVGDSGIEIDPIQGGLDLYLTSKGHVAGSAIEWSYNDIACEFTGINAASSGWKYDSKNIPVMRLTGDARMTIPFQPFGKEVSVYGKTLEFEFATSDVFDYDTVVIDCLSEGRGLQATAQAITLYSSENSLYTQYKEGEHVRVSFVISASTDKTQGKIVYCYINGIMSGAFQYNTDLFGQIHPVNITIGSDKCTTDLYSIRIYDRALTRYEIVDTWLADIQNGKELLSKIEANDIYENDIVTEAKLLQRGLPCLVIEGTLPTYKGDKKTVSGRYTDPNSASKSFTFQGAQIDVQGTSSQDYPRKNYKIKFKNGFIMSNGNTVNGYAIHGGIPVNTFTFKADYASSEGANNVELVRLYNDVTIHKTPMQETNPKIRQGIDGFPIAIFHGADFIGKYNFNNDKGTAEVYGFSEGDQSWEITGNGSDRQLFKAADFNTYAEIKADFESRYPEEDADVVITQLKEMMTWVASTDTTVEGLEKTEIEARLNKFRTEFDNYFDRDSTFFYYLFTEAFLMVDSRAKNAFPSLFQQDGKWCWLPYDMDTALGIDNGGRLAFSYNLEDIDTIDGHNVFNGQDSVLWTNLRKCFYSELEAFYRDNIRNNDNFTYDSIEKRFEDHQSKWPVSLWNEDAYYKYIDPILQTGENRLYMLQGSKEAQRKWWLYNRFRYIDSKYNAGNAKSSFLTLRAYSNNRGSSSVFEITPYADIYARVNFDAQSAFARAARGEKTTLTINGIENPNDLVVNIFSADQLAEVGDLSGFLPGQVNLAAAINLQSIKVGDSSSSYTNPNLTQLVLGANRLLKSIDARNCTALNTPVTAEQCISLEEAYFENTKIPSISLPNGGMVKTLHLPDSLVYLQLRNLSKLTDLQIAGYSNLRTVWIENPSEAIMDIVPEMIIGLPEGANVRALGIDVTVDSESELLSFFERLGTLRGLDAEGNPTSAKAAVSGIIHIDTMTYDDKEKYETLYPDFTIDAKHLMCRVRFYDDSGSTLLMDPVYVEKGASVSYTGQVPTKTATAQYNYTFAGWSLEKNSDENNLYEGLNQVDTNIDLYAAFSAQLRYYRIKFVNASYSPATVLQSTSVAYGETPIYTGQPPVYNPSASDAEEWGEHLDWTPQIVPVVGDATYTAKFKSLVIKTRRFITRTIKMVENDSITSIKSSVFYDCSALTSVKLPSVTGIGSSAFKNCSALTSVELPSATSIGYNAFYGCSALTNVSFPLVTSIGSSAFDTCGALTNVSFPLVTSIKSSAFKNCSALTNVSFPLVTSIGSYGFQYCYSLTSVELPSVLSIDTYAFGNCGRLETMYIGTKSSIVCNLLSTDAIPSNVTKIYVPFPLLDEYKTAKNWSSFANKITAYEEPVECLSLSITAEDAPWYATTTTVHVTATCKYKVEGVSQGDATKVFTWDDTSAAFEQNSEESQRNVTINVEFLGASASTTIVQDKYRTDLVGGTIFYIDSSADGVYEFYDRNGELISDVAVGDKPYSYKVITPGSKDRYYVYHDELYDSLQWSNSNSGTGATGTAIGTGKSNTATLLASDEVSKAITIWYKLQQVRNTSVGGCNDWFVPSRDEGEALRQAIGCVVSSTGAVVVDAGAVTGGIIAGTADGMTHYRTHGAYYCYPSNTKFLDTDLWSSSESNANNSNYWYCSYQRWSTKYKTSTSSVFFTRAF